MRLPRYALAGSLALALGCLSIPAPHPRALINNDLCVQEINRGNYRQAETYCNLGLEFSPQYANLWTNKGLIYRSQGRHDEAKASFIKAIRFNQDDALAYNNLGQMYEREGALGQAHDNYRQSLRINPDYLNARYNLGTLLIKMKRYQEAEKELLTLVAIHPNIADGYHELAIIAYEHHKDKRKALEYFRRAVQLSPSVSKYWHDVGFVLMDLGQYADARDAFAQCLQLDQKDPNCLQRVAEAQHRAALLQASLQEAKSLQGPQATSPELLLLARQYRQQGLLDKEEEAYRQCLKVDGRFAPCHWGLFQLYSERRRPDFAQVACKNFLKYGSVEEYPSEMQQCEKYLASSAP